MKVVSKFVVFCLVGFCSFLIDWSLFNVLYYTGIGFVMSRTTSVLASMTFTFCVNRNFTFSARGIDIKKQVIRWLTLYLTTLVINVSVGKLVLMTFGENLLNANIAFFAGLAVAVPLNFFGSLLWVFKKERENSFTI